MDDEQDIEVIMPSSISKYCGGIHKRNESKNTKYKAVFCKIGENQKRFSVTFNNYGDALQWIKTQNELENNIRVRNIIYKHGDRYECSLPCGKRMLFDGDDIRLVQSHLWYCNSKGYASTSISGDTYNQVTFLFHILLLGHAPNNMINDHFNRNRLDNRQDNLRPGSRQLNSINRGVTCRNIISGQNGVSEDKFQNRWVATWVNNDGIREREYFSISGYGYETAKEKAIECRKQKERELPHYREALFGKNI